MVKGKIHEAILDIHQTMKNIEHKWRTTEKIQTPNEPIFFTISPYWNQSLQILMKTPFATTRTPAANEEQPITIGRFKSTITKSTVNWRARKRTFCYLHNAYVDRGSFKDTQRPREFRSRSHTRQSGKYSKMWHTIHSIPSDTSETSSFESHESSSRRTNRKNCSKRCQEPHPSDLSDSRSSVASRDNKRWKENLENRNEGCPINDWKLDVAYSCIGDVHHWLHFPFRGGRRYVEDGIGFRLEIWCVRTNKRTLWKGCTGMGVIWSSMLRKVRIDAKLKSGCHRTFGNEHSHQHTMLECGVEGLLGLTALSELACVQIHSLFHPGCELVLLFHPEQWLTSAPVTRLSREAARIREQSIRFKGTCRLLLFWVLVPRLA